MAATARVVENVGVSAYLGGATLITDPVLLDAAGSILTVEARHQTILNVLSGTGTAIPAAFDIPLAPNEILAMAGPFFDGPCDLGVPANPTLAITNTGTVAPGTKLTFSSSAINGSTDVSIISSSPYNLYSGTNIYSFQNLFCQMLLGGQPNSTALPFNNCVVPPGINGPVAIFITSDGQPLVNNVRDRASSQIVAGPTMAFIDTQPQTLGSLVRGTNTTVASTSTVTISPAEASAIIASATPVALSAPPLANSVINTNGGPNEFTGASPDGSVIVNGWSLT